MSKLRHFTTTLAVLGLVATALALITAPATAQSDDEDDRPPPAELFIFSNEMENPDANNDGVPDRRWQARVMVTALGNCVPRSGQGSYDSFWLDAGEEVAARLSPTECVFRISARVRVESTGCEYRAQLVWRDDTDSVVGDYHNGSILTSGRPDDESRISVRRHPDSGCTRPHRTYFLLGGDAMVQELPGSLPDEGLRARARRAATVGEFTVRVEPEAPDTRATGCAIGGEFTLQGDQSRSAQVLGATGDRCPSRATIVAAPPYVWVSHGYVAFDAALPNIIVNLTPLVRIAASRIAVVQDAVGSANQGQVSYSVTRSCGGEVVPSPAAQASSVDLFEGRFTVHSPDIPQFGPVGMYRAVATTTGSSVVVGCAVTVAVSGVPSGCVVDGGNTQTLAWSAAEPFTHFDFEFDFYCGGSTPPAAAEPQPPTTAEDAGADVAEDMIPTGDADDMVPADDGDDTGDLEGAGPPADPVGPPRDAPTG
ncbi:MAG: hypothetical protein F4121_09455 [Acidimicrobiia bacterium]|nr:hypothetical protein [Acidimicrobiia bacterium]MYC46610.1 hypothetical protein [Acidimicrobiia bacterium]MYI20273.1 hypothetical protein [Acidimicrobiia bacterium]